jgi:hypothetical protein
VKVIESSSFEKSRSLQKINYNSKLVDWCKIFRDDDGLHGDLFFMDENCINDPYRKVENIEISEDIWYIATAAFRGINSIKTVNFLEGVNIYVAEHAFSFSSLEKVIFPNLGFVVCCWWSFENCSRLSNVIIGKSLIALPSFGYCDSLSEIVLPEHINDICAFRHRCKPITITMFSQRIYYHSSYDDKYEEVTLRVPKELKAQYLEKLGRAVKCIEEI